MSCQYKIGRLSSGVFDVEMGKIRITSESSPAYGSVDYLCVGGEDISKLCI